MDFWKMGRHFLIFVTLLSACGVVKQDDAEKLKVPSREEGTSATLELFGVWTPKSPDGHFIRIEPDKVTCESTSRTDSTYEKGQAVAKAVFTANTIEVSGAFTEIEPVSTTSAVRSCMDRLLPTKHDWETAALSIRVVYKISNGVLTITRYQEISNGYAATERLYIRQ